MKRLKILWQGICLVFITMVLFTGCNETKSEDNTVAISVETKTIAAETIEQYKTISSTVLAENEVAVMPKVSGTVLKVYHQVGDKVKAGDILFEIEASDLEVQVESAQAALSSSQASLVSAQANYEKETGSSMENQLSQLQADVDNLELQYQNLLDTYEKNEQLYEADVISKQTLDDSKLNVDTTKTQLEAAKEELRITEQKSQAETKKISQASVNQAKASVEQAQSSLKSAEQQLSYAKVVAEIDGMISSCQVTKGSTVTTQSTAMTLVDMDRVKISFQVSDDVINQIKVGAKAYISIQAASDEPFEGTVSTIAPAADSSTMLYPVEIYIDNADHVIKQGMFASLQLVLGVKENTISVPIEAMVEENGVRYVYVVDENNIAHQKEIQIGIQNDTNVEVTEGIEIGDKVVVTGQDFLSDGILVNITKNSKNS